MTSQKSAAAPMFTKQVHWGRAIQSVKAGLGLVKAECSFQMPMKNLGICVELDNLRGFFSGKPDIKKKSLYLVHFFSMKEFDPGQSIVRKPQVN